MTAQLDATRQWWVLAGSCASLFLLMLDSTALTLALPDIQRDLDASSEALQWVINGYLLAMCVLVVTLSRLGDQFGRRTVFLIGNAIFAVGAVVCATAPSPAVLIGGRILQGAGGAAMLGLSLAIVSNAFSDEDRPRALGIWTAVSAIALAVGPLVGGVLIDQASWRGIFWMAVPIALLGMAITRWKAPNRTDESAGRQLDIPGLLAITLGLSAVILALVQGQAWGWGSAATIGLLAFGVAALVSLWFVEHRVAHPIIEFGLFRSRSYLGATAAAFALVGAYWVVMYLQPQYLQNILGYSPIEAGLLVLPITVPMIFLSTVAGHSARRFGVRPTMTLGMVLGTAGLLLQTRVQADSDYWTVLFPAFLLFGVSLALVYTPMSTAAMEALPRAKAGIAAGVLAMNRLLAGSLLLAITGAVFAALEAQQVDAVLAEHGSGGVPAADRGELDGLLAGSAPAKAQLAGLPSSVASAIHDGAAEAFSYALAHSMWVLVAVGVVGTALTWWLLAGQTTAAAAVADAEGPVPAADQHHYAQHRRPH